MAFVSFSSGWSSDKSLCTTNWTIDLLERRPVTSCMWNTPTYYQILLLPSRYLAASSAWMTFAYFSFMSNRFM